MVYMMKVLVFVCLCVLLLGSVEARGRGGGGRSGRSGGSRSSSRSRSGSSTRRSYKYGPYGSSVSKYTPIPVRTSSSPVIRKQTSIPTRTSLHTRLFIGYLLVRHRLNNGPVYRERYPLYRGEVTIPEERAIRVNFTEEKMLDSKGSPCVGQNVNSSLMTDYQRRIDLVTTIVRYEGINNPGHVYYGDNSTLELDKAALDKSVEVLTLVKYNGSIIANTNCTQVKSVMNGTIVRLYATNPDSAGIVRSSLWMVFLSAVLYFALE